jgi:hypothetical protein
MSKLKFLLWSILRMSVLCFALGAAPLHADQIFYAAGSGPDGGLSARADVTTGNGTLAVMLTNLVRNEVSIGQAISDFGFTIDGAAITSASVSSTTGTAENILSPSSHSSAPGTTSRWHVDQLTGNDIHLTVLGGAQPNYLIAGISDSNGDYPNTNASMEVHSPVFVQSAMITMNVGGVTADSTVSQVEFSFGTGPEVFLYGDPALDPVPEQSSIVLLVAGALFLVSAAKLRRRNLLCELAALRRRP